MAFGALLGQNPGGSGGFTKNEILAPETPPIYNLGADATPIRADIDYISAMTGVELL